MEGRKRKKKEGGRGRRNKGGREGGINEGRKERKKKERGGRKGKEERREERNEERCSKVFFKIILLPLPLPLALFADLDTHSHLGVISYGLSTSTLEDVFFKLEVEAETDQRGKNQLYNFMWYLLYDELIKTIFLICNLEISVQNHIL